MRRIVLVGNSGSGKSTLATRLARDGARAHLDLDTLAWEPVMPPRRRSLAASVRDVTSFLDAHARDGWVIEGCYADLVATTLAQCTHMLLLNPGIDACIANARSRPWEPHKYASKEAQDANLEMLLGWIREYETRTDVFSLAAHRALFDAFDGAKTELTTRETIAAWPSE